MAGMGYTESVLAYFQRFPDQAIDLDRLVAGVNADRARAGMPLMTPKQVKGAISNIRFKNGQLEIVESGQAWRFDDTEPEVETAVGSMAAVAVHAEAGEVEKVWCPEPGVIFRWNLVEHKLYRVTIAEIPL